MKFIAEGYDLVVIEMAIGLRVEVGVGDILIKLKRLGIEVSWETRD